VLGPSHPATGKKSMSVPSQLGISKISIFSFGADYFISKMTARPLGGAAGPP
jgi:hypothetical protein